MLRLKNYTQTLITEYVLDVLISENPNIIKNRLLDGSYHVQTIGTSVKKIDLSVMTNQAGKELIDESYAKSQPLILEKDTIYYEGIIDNAPSHDYLTKGSHPIYRINLDIIILSEGSL